MFKQPLVSIIIPCFNAELWIAEGIDSCLKQNYPNIEIIVIDDGSTDTSLNIIKSYGDEVTWETGPNRGGNHARNRGFTLSKGEYIQYLDADDYLRSEKIQRQVEYLETTGADVVYGDWQHQYHYPDGTVNLDKVKVSGEQSDILASLLSGWWVAPACLLFRRSAVEAADGWDETLAAGQDKDFFIAVAMSGVNIKYQPGCHSVYRRYGNTTVSTSSTQRYVTNHIKILKKYEQQLTVTRRLSAVYRDAIAQSYFIIARKSINYDFNLYLSSLNKVLSLSPSFRAGASERTGVYNITQRVIGFKFLEFFTVLLKRPKEVLLQFIHILSS